MSALSEKYSSSRAVVEAGQLTELDLAALLIPREGSLGEDEGTYQAVVSKVELMLSLSMAERLERQCAQSGCHTMAQYVLTDGEEKLMSCQDHLTLLIDGPCVVTVLNQPPQ